MNRRIITIIIALAAVAAWAQEKQSKIGYVAMSNIDNYITIDTATVRVWYALNALDIKDENVQGMARRFAVEDWLRSCNTQDKTPSAILKNSRP
jgi:hypothetical protein